MTVQTINECKQSMLALIKIDKGVIADLSGSTCRRTCNRRLTT
jgi:hypothetical protein